MSTDIVHLVRNGWKVFTHDWRSPIQGGEPLKIETFPKRLPKRDLDSSTAECGAGWNYCADLHTAFRIAGMWPTGRPSRAVVVEAAADAIARGDKRRSSRLTLIREATETEVEDALREFSKVFGEHAEFMAVEQTRWRRALGRPSWNEAKVEAGLRDALKLRGLESWTLKRYTAAWAAWDAWAARDAWDARDAWAAWDARAARDAWDARDAWAARAAWDARAARDAWDARDALTVSFAARRNWITVNEALLTEGIRDAYENGLELAVPVEKGVLGYAMAENHLTTSG